VDGDRPRQPEMEQAAKNGQMEHGRHGISPGLASDRLKLNQLEAQISRYLNNLEQDSRIGLIQPDPILL
jgi:hypothetical protein